MEKTFEKKTWRITEIIQQPTVQPGWEKQDKCMAVGHKRKAKIGISTQTYIVGVSIPGSHINENGGTCSCGFEYLSNRRPHYWPHLQHKIFLFDVPDYLTANVSNKSL